MTMTITMIAGLLFAPLAFAGGTDTDTGTDTGTDTTDGTETTEESDGECGSCDQADEVAWITVPEDGAVVESPFTVTVDSTYYCYCDDCGCSTASFTDVTIQADGVQVAAGVVGSFELDLEPGVHMLTVSAIDPDYDDAITTSAPITVTVIGDGGGTDDDGGSGLTADAGDSDESGGMADDQAAEGGCSCDASPSPMPIGTGLALLGLLALRRRRA